MGLFTLRQAKTDDERRQAVLGEQPALSDDERLLLELKRERRTFVAESTAKPFREAVLEALRQRREQARKEVESLLAAHAHELDKLDAPGNPGFARVFAAWQLAEAEDFWQALEQALEQAPANRFAEVSYRIYNKRLADFDAKIAATEARIVEARKAEARAKLEAELAAL
ncbi:MAG TPA: hypothetical protein VNK94_07315 [Gaiellaceae bacterium]|nr:hypothetical protein [Gaiellaceae bacterium]